MDHALTWRCGLIPNSTIHAPLPTGACASAVLGVIIHPGFVKSGTTSLQYGLFERHSGIFPVGIPYRSHVNMNIERELRRVEGLDYNEDKLRALIDSVLAEQPNATTAVLSCESLTIHPHLLEPIARRLHSLFPAARVMFTIRHQLRAVESFYGQIGRRMKGVPKPYNQRHVRLDNWLEHHYREWPASELGIFDYDATIRIYEEIFGRGRIDVLLFEDMTHDAPLFADQIGSALSIEASAVRQTLSGQHMNQQPSGGSVALDRLTNRYRHNRVVRAALPRGVNTFDRMKPLLTRGNLRKVTIPPDWISRLQDLYRSGNQTLATRYDLSLGKYEYPIE
jgi:hypothetical protein